MEHSKNVTGRLPKPLIGGKASSDAVLLSFMDHPRKKAADLLKNVKRHKNIIDNTLKGTGPPCGAKVIDLDEYRWMKMFDEL